MAKQYVIGSEKFSNPTKHQVHLDAIMTNIAIAYRNEGYIADQVFPSVRVNKQSDRFFKFEKGNWFRNDAKMRASGARAARVEYSLSNDLYACVEYAAAKGIPDEVIMNADNPLAPERETTDFVTEKLLLAKEIDVATLVTTSANWTTTGTPSGGVWSADTSDPINDMTGSSGIMETMRALIGRYPNTLVLGATVWAALQRHPDILDRVKYTQMGVVTEQLVASLFHVNKLLVGRAIKNTALEGATDSFSDIWGNYAWIGWVPPAPGLMVPAAGYTFQWKNRVVNRYREDQEHQDVIEALESWDCKVCSADSGYLLTSVV